MKSVSEELSKSLEGDIFLVSKSLEGDIFLVFPLVLTNQRHQGRCTDKIDTQKRDWKTNKDLDNIVMWSDLPEMPQLCPAELCFWSLSCTKFLFPLHPELCSYGNRLHALKIYKST